MIDQQAFEKAVQTLKQGDPVIFPTDTLFGIGVSVAHASNVDILYHIKQRDADKPISWLVEDTKSLKKYGSEVPSYAYRLAQENWPGPLTLVVKANDDVPSGFRSKQGTIALRMPDNEVSLALIQALGAPIATTSANTSGNEDPKTFQSIESMIMDAVPCALDDGIEHSGIGSTVVDCTGQAPLVLREGQIDINDI